MNKTLFFCDKDWEQIKYRFKLPSDIANRLHKHYLKVWQKDYFVQQLCKLQVREGNKSVYAKGDYINDGGILYQCMYIDESYILDQSAQIGISFRAIDNSQGYAIIKPWKSDHKVDS